MRSGSVNVICITLAISPFQALLDSHFNRSLPTKTGAADGFEQPIRRQALHQQGAQSQPTGPHSPAQEPVTWRADLNLCAAPIVPFRPYHRHPRVPLGWIRAFSRPIWVQRRLRWRLPGPPRAEPCARLGGWARKRSLRWKHTFRLSKQPSNGRSPGPSRNDRGSSTLAS
jgi:hypothetical protein